MFSGPTAERHSTSASLALAVEVIDMLQLPLSFGRWQRDVNEVVAYLLPSQYWPKQANSHHRPAAPG